MEGLHIMTGIRKDGFYCGNCGEFIEHECEKQQTERSSFADEAPGTWTGSKTVEVKTELGAWRLTPSAKSLGYCTCKDYDPGPGGMMCPCCKMIVSSPHSHPGSVNAPSGFPAWRCESGACLGKPTNPCPHSPLGGGKKPR
jgi:hypothetical protein